MTHNAFKLQDKIEEDPKGGWKCTHLNQTIATLCSCLDALERDESIDHLALIAEAFYDYDLRYKINFSED